MKKFIKSLILGAAITISCSLEAQQNVLSTNLVPGTTQVLLTNAAYVSAITVNAGTYSTNVLSNNPQTLVFFDSSTTNTNEYISNAWYSRSTVMTNTTNVLTNGVGQVYTNIYPGQWTVIVTNSASTNSLPALQYIAVPPSASINRTTRIITTSGLNVIVPAGMSNATITVFYANPF